MAWTPPQPRAEWWQVTKPAVRGRHGIVVAQAAEGAAAGAALLEAGGSAADAAVGTAFALAAAEPWNSGLGGIGFAQVAGPGVAPETIDFGPVAPAALDPAAYPLRDGPGAAPSPWPGVEGDRNVLGPLSWCVPSAVAGYALLHARHGRLPWAEVLAPALALAKRGLRADWFVTLKVASCAALLRRDPEAARTYLPAGLPPEPPYHGTPGCLRLDALAETIERLAREGADAFYRGGIAADLAADAREAGAVLNAADLAGCSARVVAPLATAWGGRTVWLAAGRTAGPTLAQVLAALPPAQGSAPDPAWYAALARALRAAFATRLAGGGAGPAPGGSTTHLTVADRDGMMVAMTTTLLSTFGSGVVLPRTGVLMNNGVMWFDPRPGRPNGLAAGRRPLTNMGPAIASEVGGARPALALGASGGRHIPAAVVQVLAFAAGFGMAPDAALAHPRIDVAGAEVVGADLRLDPAVVAALAAEAAVTPLEWAVLPGNFARPNLIRVDADGEAEGAAEPTLPGAAAIAAAG